MKNLSFSKFDLIIVTPLRDYITIKICCFRYKGKTKNHRRHYVTLEEQKFVAFAL